MIAEADGTGMRILAGDIGGTKTTLALFDADSPRQALREKTFPSRAFAGLDAVVTAFLSTERPKLAAACFGIAGPVLENRCATPNLPWIVDGDELAKAQGIPRVLLINDLVAMGEGIPSLLAHETATLNPTGRSADGNGVLLAAGTGLGIAILSATASPAQTPFMVLPSEGGHMDYAPQSDEEIALLGFLRQRFAGHVSVERVLSGLGLHNVYDGLRALGLEPELPEVRDAIAIGDPGKVIAERALAGTCRLCLKTLDVFVRTYGAVAGSLALLTLARRGVWLGGGIAPQLLAVLKDGRFLASYIKKGRMQALVESIPVYVILNPKTPLFGAARRAANLAQGCHS
jgi:glucokinase